MFTAGILAAAIAAVVALPTDASPYPGLRARELPDPATARAVPNQPVQQHDSLRNGALVGAAIGAGLAIFTFGFADCPGENPGGPCPVARVAGAVFTTALFAAAGAGIDALFEDATGALAAPGVRSRPRHDVRRWRSIGARVSIRW